MYRNITGLGINYLAKERSGLGVGRPWRAVIQFVDAPLQ